MGKMVIIGAILTVVFMFIFTKIDPKMSNNPNNNQVSTYVSDYVTCNISGEVVRPGSYVLNRDSTLLDLISTAGGLTANADERSFNTTIELTDGGSYYIAKKSKVPDSCTVEEIDKVNINTASLEELMTISGIGESIARNIIEYREENGDFLYLEQLKLVTGIGNSNFEKIKDYVTLY